MLSTRDFCYEGRGGSKLFAFSFSQIMIRQQMNLRTGMQGRGQLSQLFYIVFGIIDARDDRHADPDIAIRKFRSQLSQIRENKIVFLAGIVLMTDRVK